MPKQKVCQNALNNGYIRPFNRAKHPNWRNKLSLGTHTITSSRKADSSSSPPHGTPYMDT